MILNDRQIMDLCEPSGDRDPMISPYSRFLQGRPSWGLSSFGYDIRIDRHFKVFRGGAGVVDPLSFDPAFLYDHDGPFIDMPPNSYVLGVSIERFAMPLNVMAICVGKSTYARCGVIVNVTPLEPGWRGHLTIEISNSTPASTRVHAGEGIAQLLFFRGSQPSVTYADRFGKYQNQIGVTLPR